MCSIKVVDVPPASAIAFAIQRYNSVRIVDVLGQQVGDFVCFNEKDLREKLSTGRTRSENGKIRISIGDKLYSNRCNEMFTITQDTCVVHDLLYPPCSRWVFEHRYKVAPHDGCQENLVKALSAWKISEFDLPDPFNVFEHSVVDIDGRLKIMEPVSRAGNYIELEAEMDCIVGISACAVDVGLTNAGKCKPLQIILQVQD